MEIKTARNWYWWLWLSPLLTLPTLGLIISNELYSSGTSNTQIFYTGVFVSALWHLILLIPARNPSSKFIRWHGWQALTIAGIRTITAFLVVLLGNSDGSVIVIIFMILVWFFGTIFGMVQASRGACILWCWFGNQDMGPLLEPKPEPEPKSEPVKTWDEFLEQDVDALVEIIRFNTDPEQRQTALKKLHQLGLVESLDGESISTTEITSAQTDQLVRKEETPLPEISKIKTTPKKRNDVIWVVLFLVIIGLLFGPSLCRSISRPYNYVGAPSSTRAVVIQTPQATMSPEEKNKMIADSLISEVWDLAYAGRIEDALEKISEAQELDPDVYISSGVWNDLCWYGALSGYAAEVFEACETAVEIHPENGGHRDSRGVARAILGDYEGAIDDFQAFIDWAQVFVADETKALERQRWIEDLEKGINPFDEETLDALKVP